jgi:hypothetical protein
MWFWFIPKRLQGPHPQLVHWWLLVHSSPGKDLREEERERERERERECVLECVSVARKKKKKKKKRLSFR